MIAIAWYEAKGLPNGAAHAVSSSADGQLIERREHRAMMKDTG